MWIFAGLAQLEERLICNQRVGGSSPSPSATFNPIIRPAVEPPASGQHNHRSAIRPAVEPPASGQHNHRSAIRPAVEPPSSSQHNHRSAIRPAVEPPSSSQHNHRSAFQKSIASGPAYFKSLSRFPSISRPCAGWRKGGVSPIIAPLYILCPHIPQPDIY